MFCPKCGTETTDDSQFCRKCGQGLAVASTGTTAAVAPARIPETKPQRKLVRTPFAIAGVLLLLFLIYAYNASQLQGTAYATVRTFAELQHRAGVQIRPAVLTWRVLRRLAERNTAAELSVDEFESYLMRCSTNAEYAACADAIIAARNGGVSLAPLGTRERGVTLRIG